ncbi:MAG TPA: hypothetical protein VF229_05710 [Burkholderiaceae bacterium]
MSGRFKPAMAAASACTILCAGLPAPPACARPGEFLAPWQQLPAGSGGRVIEAPRDEFQPLAEAPWAPDGRLDWSLLHAAPWIRAGRPEVGALGDVEAAQLSGLARGADGPLHFVFGRWNAESGEMAIDVIRVQRGVDTSGRPVVQALRAPFTAHHGNRWAAARAYLTASEQLDETLAGRNPFAAFAPADRTDPVFYGISRAGAEVAVGHAMLHYRAVLGVLAVSSVRPGVTQSRGGNWFRRTLTTTVIGTGEVQWRVATPVEAQPWGAQSAICVVRTACTDAACTRRAPCPAPELVAWSRAAFDDWGAGSLPQAPQEIYRWSTTQSSWSLLALTAFIGLTVYGGDLLAGAATVHGLGIGDGIYAPPQSDSPQWAAMRDRVRDMTLSGPASSGQLGAIRDGYTASAPTPAAIDPHGVANQVHDTILQFDRCSAQGRVAQDLNRCAAPIYDSGMPAAPN